MARRQRSSRSRTLTDHDQIRNWAQERGARPACVRQTGGNGDVGMIRLDFPGYSGEQSLEEVSWDDWFRKFDESKLALLVQDETAGGEQSNFNKLIGRETAEGAEPRRRGRERSRAKRTRTRGSRRSAGSRSTRSRSRRVSGTSSRRQGRSSGSSRSRRTSSGGRSRRTNARGQSRSRSARGTSSRRSSSRRSAGSRTRNTSSMKRPASRASSSRSSSRRKAA